MASRFRVQRIISKGSSSLRYLKRTHLHRLSLRKMGCKLTKNSNQSTKTTILTTSSTQKNFSSYNHDNEFGDIQDIDPLDLEKQRSGKGDNLKYLIIDVREANELENGYNLGTDKKDWIHIPMGQILQISDAEEFADLVSSKGGIDDFDDYEDLYFMCKAGVRSMTVCNHVVQLDLDQTLFNVTGGISKYDKDVGL